MAEKFNFDSKLNPQILAQQLKQPDGEMGKQLGLEMNKGNKHICLNSYKVLDPQTGNHILEIGMGNGFFIKELLDMAENLNYTGVDFSAIMIQEARLLNKAFIDVGKVRFEQASIEALPFEDNSFDCITTTNTLYFWPHPENNAKELLRVLKPEGKLLIAYREKNCMDQMAITQYGFAKYNANEVEQLLGGAGFKQTHTTIIKEPELDFDGTILQMEGFYTIGING